MSLRGNNEPVNEPVSQSHPGDNASMATFQFLPKYQFLMDVYDEWFGTGDFQDVSGGNDGREKLFKAKWRRHLGASGNKQLSNNN